MHARKDRERNDFINELKQDRINATEVKEVPDKNMNWRARGVFLKSPRQSITARSKSPRQLQRNLRRHETKPLHEPNFPPILSGGVQTRGSQVEAKSEESEITLRI